MSAAARNARSPRACGAGREVPGPTRSARIISDFHAHKLAALFRLSWVPVNIFDYVPTDQNGLTATSTRTVLIVTSPSIVPTDDASTTAATSASTTPTQ